MTSEPSAGDPLRDADRYRTVFNSIDEGFCVLEMLFDPAGRPLDYRFLEANRVFEDQTGLRNAVGRTARELVPDLEPHWFEIYGRVARTGEPERFVNGSDAMNRWFDVYAFRVGGDGSRQVGLLFKDITQRRRREVNLAFLADTSQELARLNRIEELLRVAGARVGAHLQLSACVFVNPGPQPGTAAVAHAWSSGDMPVLAGTYRIEDFEAGAPDPSGMRRETVVADTSADARVRAGAYAALGIRAFASVPFVEDGAWRFSMVACHRMPHEWRDDEIALIRELTIRVWTRLERARADEALRESEQRARLALAIARLGTWTWDPERDEIAADERCREICFLGNAPRLSMKDIVPRIHPDDWPHVEAALRAATDAAGDGAYAMEVRFVNRDGGVNWVVSRGQALFTDGPHGRRVTTVVGSVLDITSRKQQEAELRAANQTKDEFLATLSHELRTPLNAVVGWSHILRSGNVRPDVRDRAFDSIERNAKLQARLVDDLLDVSRIVSGKLQMSAERVDVAAVVAGAIETVAPMAAARGVSLQVTAAPAAELLVTGDAGRLRQVVWNLLSNAVKFTPEGGRVDVALGGDDGHAEIVVRDTGQGIAAEFLPHVFERFRQADGSTTRRHGGLGLGLAIARYLIEAHGGTVTAASDGEGQGATFTVRLPVREEARVPVARSTSPSGVQSLRGAHALVVDDQADARELTAAILESAGARVSTAGSVEDALGLLARGGFDVVLADIGMPERDGYSLVTALRREAPDPARRIPAIAVTAYATVADREAAMAAGFDRHLAKPVDPSALVDLVAQLLTAAE